MNIKQMLKYAVDKNASDLHLASGLKPLVRIDGDLTEVEGGKVLTEDNLLAMLKEVLPEQQYLAIRSNFEQDLALVLPDVGRFRVNIFHQMNGTSVAFRTIPLEIQTLEDLKMPNILSKLCNLPLGLVLVTGPTGVGKSTTLAAMIDYVNANKRCHILTIEDPIEFVHQSKNALIQQREVHQHTGGFHDALRSALREDPDVILVGEMRDLETIRLALTAAETGHLVFATLHTASAAKTINRVIDVFPEGEKPLVRTMLAESLQAVVSQVLVKKRGGGRIAVQEIMICNPAIRNSIRKNEVSQIYTAMQTNRGMGMITLNQAFTDLIDKEIIDSSERREEWTRSIE